MENEIRMQDAGMSTHAMDDYNDQYDHIDNSDEMREHQEKQANRVYVSESYWY